MYMRNVLNRLMQERKYRPFLDDRPLMELPDYESIVTRPMTMEAMMDKLDAGTHGMSLHACVGEHV